MIPVRYLNFNPGSPASDYWDMDMLSDFFKRDPFNVCEVDLINDGNDFSVIIIPTRHNYDYVEEINEYINRFHGVVLILAGDEESKFPVEKIKHKNINIWLMTPHAGKIYEGVDRFIGENYTRHTRNLRKEAPTKDLNWFFSGQVTHPRRIRCVQELRKLKNGVLIETPGFTQGIEPDKYMEFMERSKIIPCPSGPATPDTFRFYEALEAGCIPIADAISTINKTEGYWNLLFGEDLPFPIIKDWKEFPDLMNYYIDTFAENSNKIFAWWQMYKRNLFNSLIDDFESLHGHYEQNREGITVLVATSPTRQHPDTSMLEETIHTVRTHLPDAEIIITFDGIREEQSYLKENYEEYKRRVLWKCNREWTNVVPIVFGKHTHQVGMAREALKHVRTDKILYVEHDAPITPDMDIDWDGISLMIDLGHADLVRFHFEAHIPKEHEYLMIDKAPVEVCGVPAVRTVQWSQRPHLASVDFYNRILRDHFSPEAITFVEDKMHGVVISAYKLEQLQGWNKFKLWIYHPEGNIKRSYHTDGRGDEDKYSMTF